LYVLAVYAVIFLNGAGTLLHTSGS